MYNILILVDTSRASGRKFLAGVERYAAFSADWQVFIRPPNYLGTSSQTDIWFRFEEIDGIIARDAVNILNILKSEKPKVINDTRREVIPGCSTIITDSSSIGKMAAEHFLGLGFENFAYCGFRGLPWSQKRFISFKKTLENEGVTEIHEYKDDPSSGTESRTERWKISEWLRKLPHPACVFACNDDRAIYILEACKIAGLNVPQQVAVLGVDNDELMCNLSNPSLSSIELDFEKSGFLAAGHLSSLIRSNIENRIITVAPLEVISRRSTDFLAIDDLQLVSALIYIRASFMHPIQTADVVESTGLSRRELEKRFKKILRRTIKGEIERLRIDLIKKKLLSGNQSVRETANELEFIDPEHFSRYFRNLTGQTPLQFRSGSCSAK